MKKTNREKLYNYRYDHGRVYKFSNDQFVKPRHIKVDVDENRKPKTEDFMQCMEMLLDFRAIKPPLNGTEIHAIIPEFETMGELISWRSRMINQAIESW